MKRSTIFSGMATVVLFIAGVFALKANKRLSHPATIYYFDGSTYNLFATGCSSNPLFTTTAGGMTAYFEDGGPQYGLYYYTGFGVYAPVYTNAF